MNTTILTVLVAVGIVALMMVVLGFKMLTHKEKEYRRPCTNADPTTGRCAHCTCDAKKGIKKEVAKTSPTEDIVQ